MMAQKVRNQKGQALLEGILLLAILMFMATATTKFLQEKKVAAKLVAEPWGKLAGMIECGTWAPCGAGLHPQTMDRVLSLSPSGR